MTTTAVSFLLDETGSMNQRIDDAIGSFNNYVRTLREESDEDVEYRLTLKKFNKRGTELLAEFDPLEYVPELSKENYRPNSGTPLIDASVELIRETEEKIEKAEEDIENVVFVILTDGKENSSVENSMKDLNSLIEDKEDDGWEFVFLGVEIYAYQQAEQYGVNQDNTVSSDDRSFRDSVQATAKNTAEYSSGDRDDMSYTEDQKEDIEGS